MTNQKNYTPPIGWIGNFLKDHPASTYPEPNLDGLGALTGNMDNIDKLERQQKVLWPEFSWLTELNNKESRCYQMFAPDISRLGYDNSGQSWSIICPQQGVVIDGVGAINVEVTVTGQRGWANETSPWGEGSEECAADLTVYPAIWFTPSTHQHFLVALAWKHFAGENLPFPSTKEHAIRIHTSAVGGEIDSFFKLRKGQTDHFKSPEFAKHWKDGAWGVGNLAVEIGAIQSTGNKKVDRFNQLVLDLFNQASGNMLQKDNTLTWDVWFDTPELVDQTEWSQHAEKWRHSIDVDHGKSPSGGVSTPARLFNGKEFKPSITKLEEFEDFVKLLASV
jgi:hypothetical protein